MSPEGTSRSIPRTPMYASAGLSKVKRQSNLDYSKAPLNITEYRLKETCKWVLKSFTIFASIFRLIMGINCFYANLLKNPLIPTFGINLVIIIPKFDMNLGIKPPKVCVVMAGIGGFLRNIQSLRKINKSEIIEARHGGKVTIVDSQIQ